MPPVRWGLLGTARINRRLIPAMRAAARSEVIAIASRELSRAEAYAREWEIPHAVAGYEALLARADVDAIYIPLPNSLHIEWSLASAAAGKHVLCEKPLALDPRDVDRLEAATRQRNVIVAEGFMYRHEPLTAAVVSLVVDGAIGAVRHISSGFTYAQSRPADVLLVGRDPSQALGMARFAPSDVDEEFSGLLRFPGDRTAAVHAGFRAPYRTWLEITGSEGWMSVPNPFKPGPLEVITLERLGERRSLEVAGSPLQFVRQIDDFIGAVLDGTPSRVSLAESRRVALALTALAASARNVS
jgi:predicted dehydrogenase